MFLPTVPVEGLKNQRGFDELRTSYIKELDRLVSHCGETTRTQRLFQLTQLLDYLQSVRHFEPVRKCHVSECRSGRKVHSSRSSPPVRLQLGSGHTSYVHLTAARPQT